MKHSLPGSSVHGIFSGKNTGMDCDFLLQGIFLTWGSNLGLLYCRQYPTLQMDSLPTEPPGKSLKVILILYFICPNISKILLLQHVIDIKMINEKIHFLQKISLQSLLFILFYTDSTSKLVVITFPVLNHHLLIGQHRSKPSKTDFAYYYLEDF